MLRTVTFSDKRVADLVNTHFVSAWSNRGPGFCNLDFSTEQWIFSGSHEAYPTKNICTFFMSPQGRVFYYVAGSYSPEMFIRILEIASGLRDTLFDEKMALKPEGIEKASEIHEQNYENWDRLLSKAKNAQVGKDGWRELTKNFKPCTYRGLKHQHSPACAWSLASGYEYFVALDRQWADRKELPDFKSLQFTYLYGNEFTEETANSHHIGRPGAEPADEPPPPPPPPRGPRATRAEVKVNKKIVDLDLPGLRLIDN